MAEGEALAADAGLPWPAGDAQGVQRRAGRLGAAARAFAEVATKMGGLAAGDAGWRGFAAGRFDVSAANEAAALDSAADGLADARYALRTLADVVVRAQADVVRLARQVLELEDQVLRASNVALRTTVLAPGTPAAERTERIAGRLYGELVALRARAVVRAEDICADARTADRRCATALSALAAKAPLSSDVAPTLPATPLALVVAAAYAPAYLLDGDEDHLPMDVRVWLDHAERKEGDQGPYFDPEGEDVRNGDLDGATLPFAYSVTDEGELQLQYGTFYPFNDFPDTPSVPGPIGDLFDYRGPDHEGDFEPVMVQLGEDGHPETLGAETHGHTWALPWEDSERDGLHPRIYVADGSHGNYPRAGRYENDFSDGPHTFDHWDDRASGTGDAWRPDGTDIIDGRHVPALRSPALFGEDQGGGNPDSFLQDQPVDLDDPDISRPPEPVGDAHDDPPGPDALEIPVDVGEGLLLDSAGNAIKIARFFDGLPQPW